MKNKLFTGIVLVISLYFVFSSRVFAFVLPVNPTQTPEQQLARFRMVQNVENISLSVPTVLQFSVASSFHNQYAVWEVETNSFQPFTLVGQTNKTAYTVQSGERGKVEPALNDSNPATFVEYNLDKQIDINEEQKVDLYLTYERPITTSHLAFRLDTNVKEPTHIAIRSKNTVTGGEKVLLNKTKIDANASSFPQTIASVFIVTFYYNQPLRINEIGMDENTAFAEKPFLRFLARPKMTYRLYSLPEGRISPINTGERGDLTSSLVKPLTGTLSSPIQNPLFLAPDQDGDSVTDLRDNCKTVKNTNQEDKNSNNIGDACEDFDTDGILNSIDNCPDVPNKLQQDTDGDRIGDHCDGEESRLVEQLWFLPWVGIILGFGIVVVIFRNTLQTPGKK